MGNLKTDNIPESAVGVIKMITQIHMVERIILFGSRAIGDHDERSDIDIAISAPDLTRADLALLRDRVYQGRTLYQIAISSLESMPQDLSMRVIKQGVVIYERSEAVG